MLTFVRKLTLIGMAWPLLSGCDAPQPIRDRLNDQVRRPPRCAVIFFVDGMDYDRTAEMLAAGELPHIRRCFVEGGVSVERAITSLPALTYPNAVSLITGVLPGHHGILGNYWFDRRTLVYQNYLTPPSYQESNLDFRQPTIFEQIPEQFTVSVQAHTFRGVTVHADNTLLTGLDFSIGSPLNTDARVGDDLAWVIGVANRARRWPTVTLLYFPGVDETGHRYGPASAEYGAALRNLDTQVGRAVDALRDNRLFSQTYLVLVTDHSLVEASRKTLFDLVRWLRRDLGLRVYGTRRTAPDYLTRFATFDKYDLVAANDSARWLAIHVRGAGGWADPPDPALLARLRDSGIDRLPAVRLVCTKLDRDAILATSQGRSVRLERDASGPLVRYRIVPQAMYGIGAGDAPRAGDAADDRNRTDGADVLGYSETPDLREFVDAGWHTSREWLAATAGAALPDFVPQAVELFDSPRAGDIAVFAAEDWVFDNFDRGDHGSCLQDDMRIPLMFAGPDLPRGASVSHARLVDVMPTLLDLLGFADRLPPDRQRDGASLADELRRAATMSSSDLRIANNE